MNHRTPPRQVRRSERNLLELHQQQFHQRQRRKQAEDRRAASRGGAKQGHFHRQSQERHRRYGAAKKEAFYGSQKDPPISRLVRVARRGNEPTIVLDDGPAVNFCKPAVDPLFQSAITVWQHGIMAVILTGMGSDGMRGGKDVVAAGGNVLAQDEATSVVWGMPGAAAHAGICAAVLPLDQIAPRLVRIFSGERS